MTYTLEQFAADIRDALKADQSPAAKRKVYAGPEGLRLVALGGTPGAAYQAKEFTELEGATA